MKRCLVVKCNQTKCESNEGGYCQLFVVHLESEGNSAMCNDCDTSKAVEKEGKQ